jgi:hypothetical protein
MTERRTLTNKDFIIDKNDKGWYFTWKIWNNAGVGFYETKAKAKEECDTYIALHNQGTYLGHYKIQSLAD